MPSLLFLGVGTFKATAGLQEFFTTGAGAGHPDGLRQRCLVWIAYQLYPSCSAPGGP
ncbi:hypothetical protein LV779_22905 [Streptomyces thinghirensis]|nr:hypothetical protein [Streptomyces thinghirensis]